MPAASAPFTAATPGRADAVSALQLRFFAGAKAAYGAGSARYPLAGDAAPTTIGEVLALAVSDAHGALAADAARILSRCTFILDGVVTADSATALAGASLLDVLPPFAGG